MKNFSPTEEQARKYADYTVEVREGSLPLFLQTVDGVVCRFYATANRFDDTKTFIVFTKPGSTPLEREEAAKWALDLPRGEWARFQKHWFDCVRRDNGRRYFKQHLGHPAEDPCPQLELEMMIDATQTVDVS